MRKVVLPWRKPNRLRCSLSRESIEGITDRVSWVKYSEGRVGSCRCLGSIGRQKGKGAVNKGE